MTKSTLKLGLFSLLVAALASVPTQVRAQETNQHAASKNEAKVAKEPREASPKKAGVTPFHGKLKAVDKTAKTISLGETTIQVTSETKIIKNGQPATLEDGVIGEAVGGAYKKAEDGKLNAASIRFGAKPEAAQEASAKPEKKAKKEKKME